MEQPPFELTVAEYAALRNGANPPMLLDVREDDEVVTAKISGSRHLPMGQIAEKVGDIFSDKTDHIVVHCHHGMRSAKVVQHLRAKGYNNVQNLAGGIDAWSAEIDPNVPVY